MEQKQEPRMLTVGEAAALLPARNPGAHKGNFGRLLIVAGSAGYTGAAALCTLAALRFCRCLPPRRPSCMNRPF